MINTKEDFKALVESIEKESWYKQPLGFGIARVSRGVLNPKLILEATFPVVNWNENHKSAAVFLAALKQSGNNVDCTKSEAVFDMGDGFLGYCIEAFKPFYEEKEKQRFNNNLASGDILYFSGKSLIIDTELLEKFNMSHKLTDIVNIIAPSLSKDTSLEFELLLKSQDSFKRTGYYLSAMPHNVYEEVNKVLI